MSPHHRIHANCNGRPLRGVLALGVAVTALLGSACGGGGGDQGEVTAIDPSPWVVSTPESVPSPSPTPTPRPAPALPPTPPDPAALNSHLPPSGNFDLANWKLTLPSGNEVSTVELNSGYAQVDVFYTDAENGGMVFRCPNIAGTTSNSHYSRSELREMRAPGGSAGAVANNWSTADGGTLRATLSVDHVSTTGDNGKLGRVIIGQIHGEGAEPLRLYYHKRPHEPKGRIYAGLDSSANVNAWSPDIVPNDDGHGIALGEVFSYQIRLTGLELEVRISLPERGTETLVTSIDQGYERTKLYFKAGVYNQNNTGDISDYVQATFFALRTSH